MNRIKALTKTLLGIALTTMVAVSAYAAPIQLTPDFGGATPIATYYIDKNGTGIGGSNSNSTDHQLFRLNTYFLGSPIVETARLKPGNQTYDWSGGGLGQWDYAVVHFGAGAFGGSGGVIGAWDLNGADTFTFPQQSFSSIDLFRTRASVPEPTTLALFGLGLLGFGLRRRKKV